MRKFLNDLKNTVKKYRPPKYVIFTIFLVLVLLAFFKNSVFDPDTWFLLNHGRYVFEHGIPHIEPFTMHEGFEFVMQQWLSSSIFWFLYSKFGIIGLQLLAGALFGMTIYFLYKLCMLVSNNKFYLSSIITIITSSFLFIQTVLRPQLFDNLIFAMELYYLELYIRKKKNKYLIALPILSLLLVNLHASMWFMLFIFMLPYFIDGFNIDLKFIKSEAYNKKPLFIVFIIMLLIAFINPYGLDAMTYVFRSYGFSSVNRVVGEMRPLDVTILPGKVELIIVFGVLSIYMFNKQNNIKLRYLLLFCGLTYLLFAHHRNLSLFLIGVLFQLADCLSNKFKCYTSKYKGRKYTNILYVTCCFILIGYSIFIFGTGHYDDQNEPLGAIEYITKNYDVTKLKIYTAYTDGSCAEYHKLKVYLDARAEVFLKANNKKEDVFSEYYKLQFLNGDGAKFLEKYKFDLLILDKYDNLKNYMEKDYKLVYKDENREVYELKKE